MNQASPPVLKAEMDRLNTIAAYNILDTLEEEDYDNITKIASAICEAPISLITIVDEKRQWFKAKVGIPVRETPIEYSICARAIESGKDFYVLNNVEEHPDLNAFYNEINQLGFKYYAGVPLVSEKGIPFGTLCVIDKKTRELTENQIAALRVLSKQVLNMLESRRQTIAHEKTISDLTLQNEALEKFAMLAAHDIKSPLANIVTLSELLLSDAHIEKDENTSGLTGMIKSASHQLFNYIQGLIEYSTSGNTIDQDLHVFHLNDIKMHLKSIYKTYQDAEVDFDFPEDRKITSIRVVIEQILINLITNSIKYCDKPQAKIQVSFEEDEKTMFFIVSDNGPGFPDNLKELSGLFTTGTRQDRYGKQGNGIGLATVKKLAEGLKGNLLLVKTSPEGSVIRVNIPKSFL
ncbi:sensor histidine kinase [Luteibaculum oceani]|uniref:histidine kinase n=1 Tax=Luteibaculum oceani TaxID=1294296 RepID=A0A5C6V9G3_9FLAO|nr:GAF domain-containing sensor histidine kinase [Luteibaculum oceani]TXC81334.1 GAF domain-containing sensor histidine kinase [Luteibaculum oceani]